MSRTERLLDLLQILRGHRSPVTGAALADELGVSLRTLYRDVATLQGQGAEIDGEAGLGYVLRPGFMLPPLMFSVEELEALVLGSRWVAAQAGDQRLGIAAGNAISKIAAVLPPELRRELETTALTVPSSLCPPAQVDMSVLREAIRKEQKLSILYRDESGAATERTIWPFILSFFDHVRIIGAWCELRTDYRHFRLDRITTAIPTGERSPRRRQAMLKDWREKNAITPARF